MPQRAEIGCQWQQSEGGSSARVWAGPWETFLLALLSPGVSKWADVQAIISCSGSTGSQLLACAGESTQQLRHTSLQSPHGLHVPHGTALGSGAAIRDRFRRCGWKFFEGRKEGKYFILLFLLLRVLPTKCLLFTLNDFLLCCIWEFAVQFEKSKSCCNALERGWCCCSTWAGQTAVLLPDKKIGTELLRDAKPQFPCNTLLHLLLFRTEHFWYNFWALSSPILAHMVFTYLQTAFRRTVWSWDV